MDVVAAGVGAWLISPCRARSWSIRKTWTANETCTANENGPTFVGPVSGLNSLCEQARSRRPRGAGGWGIRNRKDRANAVSSCRNPAGRTVGGSGAAIRFR